MAAQGEGSWRVIRCGQGQRLNEEVTLGKGHSGGPPLQSPVATSLLAGHGGRGEATHDPAGLEERLFSMTASLS